MSRLAALTLLVVTHIMLPPTTMALDWFKSGDWVSGIDSRGPNGCVLAKKAVPSPLPKCNKPKRPVLLQEATQQGWRYAPKVYMHPQDNIRLRDPAEWWKTAKYFTNTGADDIMTNFLNDDGSSISVEEFRARSAGDPINARNRSTSKVWFTAFMEDEKTLPADNYGIVFVYMLFYPFNGCSTAVLGTNFDEKYQGIQGYICPLGIHEGDWEHVSVYVCQEDLHNEDPSSAIQRVQYNQHSWTAAYDCPAGECSFEPADDGLNHLVLFSSLYGHSSYPDASPLNLYARVAIPLVNVLEGFYIGDFTARGGPEFHPNCHNVRWLPSYQQMTPAQRVSPKYEWMLFRGRWGAWLRTMQYSITCFSAGFVEQGSCQGSCKWYNPSGCNPAYQFASRALETDVINPDTLPWTFQPNNTGSETSQPAGPLVRADYSLGWRAELDPPLYKLAEELKITNQCPFANPDNDDNGMSVPLVSLPALAALASPQIKKLLVQYT